MQPQCGTAGWPGGGSLSRRLRPAWPAGGCSDGSGRTHDRAWRPMRVASGRPPAGRLPAAGSRLPPHHGHDGAEDGHCGPAQCRQGAGAGRWAGSHRRRRRRPLLCRLLRPGRPCTPLARPPTRARARPALTPCPRSPPCSTRCARTPRRRPPTSPSAPSSPTSASWRCPTRAWRRVNACRAWLAGPPISWAVARSSRPLSRVRSPVDAASWQGNALGPQAADAAASAAAAACLLLACPQVLPSRPAGTARPTARMHPRPALNHLLIPVAGAVQAQRQREADPHLGRVCGARAQLLLAPRTVAAAAVDASVTPPPLLLLLLLPRPRLSSPPLDPLPRLPTSHACTPRCRRRRRCRRCRTLLGWSRAPARARAWATSSWPTSASATASCRWAAGTISSASASLVELMGCARGVADMRDCDSNVQAGRARWPLYAARRRPQACTAGQLVLPSWHSCACHPPPPLCLPAGGALL